MPYNYRQLDNHAKATPKSGTVTAPGLYGKVDTSGTTHARAKSYGKTKAVKEKIDR